MLYSVRVKTDSAKTSMETNCNDFDMALLYFKSYVKNHWDMLGDIEIILIRNDGDLGNKILYRLEKSW
jgi:hypothetical protein